MELNDMTPWRTVTLEKAGMTTRYRVRGIGITEMPTAMRIAKKLEEEGFAALGDKDLYTLVAMVAHQVEGYETLEEVPVHWGLPIWSDYNDCFFGQEEPATAEANTTSSESTQDS